MIHYRLDIKPDFDLRWINTLHGVASGNLPGVNVDKQTGMTWVWRKRFEKFLHPDVVEIAIADALARTKRGEVNIWQADEEQLKADEREYIGHLILGGA